MQDAIGLLETKGMVPLIDATDAMAKAANVQIIKRIGIGGGMVTTVVRGDVGSVRAAVEAGANAANAAGAMVVANYITSPQFQLVMADPDRWGWLITTDPRLWDELDQETLANYEQGVATLPADVLAAHALPEPPGDWVTAMEQGWIENVLEN